MNTTTSTLPPTEQYSVEDLPPFVREPLYGFNFVRAHARWAEFLVLNGGESPERWLVVAKAIAALRQYRKYPDRPIEGWLADFGISHNHHLVSVAHTTVAVLDDTLFPNASLLPHFSGF